MSSSTRCRYSVSEISMPATKAPSAIDSPASSVSCARPSVIRRTFSMNSSADLPRATMRNQSRIRRWPRKSTTVSTTTALSSAMPTITAISSGGRENEGIRIRSGTTAMSWKSSTPITSRPCAESSSRRSVRSLVSTAVELIASAPPSATPACQPSPKFMTMAQVRATVSRTCSAPSPNTMRFIAYSLGKENSSPIENIRKTTPNSARCCAAETLLIRLNACGPISAPTSR